MINIVVILLIWAAMIFACIELNRYFKRKPGVVIDYDPSKPAIHWEDGKDERFE